MQKNKKQQTFVIAEMAWSHDGSVAKAKKIIRGAAQARAQAISFHLTKMEDYMVRNYGVTAGQIVKKRGKKESMYEYLRKLNLKDNDWRKLFSLAKKLGLSVCVMPNDNESLELCRKLKPDIYILAAACFTEENFVIAVAKQKRPLILRIGGATLSEIKNTVSLIKKQGVKKIILLHGIQSYPTKIEDTNLNLIPVLIKMFKLPVGLADHIDAESEMARIIPLMAIAKGATVIEKHLTHDRTKKGVDYVAALNTGELKKLIEDIKEAEKALGSSEFKKLSLAELKYRKMVRKRAVAKKNIRKGEKITRNNITFKRANEGAYSEEIKKIINRHAKADIKKDEAITLYKII